MPSSSTTTLPVASPVSAGHGFVNQDCEQQLDLHAYFTNGRRGHFIAQVTGDSAVPQIMPGAMVVFDAVTPPINGDMVVASHNDLIYIKILEVKPKLRLVSPNESYSPIEVDAGDNFYVLGTVVGSFMRYKRSDRVWSLEPEGENLFTLVSMTADRPGIFDMVFRDSYGCVVKCSFPKEEVVRGVKIATALLGRKLLSSI